jgi:hypothetical protein
MRQEKNVGAAHLDNIESLRAHGNILKYLQKIVYLVAMVKIEDPVNNKTLLEQKVVF